MSPTSSATWLKPTIRALAARGFFDTAMARSCADPMTRWEEAPPRATLVGKAAECAGRCRVRVDHERQPDDFHIPPCRHGGRPKVQAVRSGSPISELVDGEADESLGQGQSPSRRGEGGHRGDLRTLHR